MTDGCGAEKRRVAKRPHTGAIMRPIFSLKYGPTKKAMGRKHNILENIDAKLNNNGYKRTTSQCKTKIHNLEQKYKKAKYLD